MGITVFGRPPRPGLVTLCRERISGFRAEGCKAWFSSFILTAVAGGAGKVCAPAKLAIRMSDASENAFFMLAYLPPKFNFESLSKVRAKLSEPPSSGRAIEFGYRRDRCGALCRRCRYPRQNHQSGPGCAMLRSVGGESVMEPVGPWSRCDPHRGERTLEMGCFSRNFSPASTLRPLFFSAAMNANCAPAAFNFRSPRLELSHALHAVRSPGAAPENSRIKRALREQASESECAFAVGRFQGKSLGARDPDPPEYRCGSAC